MRMRGWRLALLWAGVTACWGNIALARGGTWITSDDYAALNAVVADSASDTEKLAAREFADLWKKATGHGVYVSNVPYLKTGVIVWIGMEGTPEELLAYVKPGELGTDGYCVRSLYLKKARQGHLAILGGKERGTMYGVYAFFEECFGVRFLTPNYTYIPKKPPASLPDVNMRYVPSILRRQTTYDIYGMQAYPDDQRTAFQRHMRWSSLPEFGLFVHTVFTLLPPDKYFAEHPDFYSEIDGKRVAPVGLDLNNPSVLAQHPELRSQLCFSNPKVAEAIVAELKPLMQASPAKTVWSISQMDWDGRCQCAACKAIDDTEGSPMGSVLTCVNRVADMIKTDFPKNYVETLAYQWSRKPPKTLRPHDNVIISVCGIDADYARPLYDKKAGIHQLFADDLAAWSKIAKNVYIWDYPANCYYAQIPYPDFDVLGPNFAFYAQQNVKGTMLCGGGLLADDLGALRCYVLSRLMWQPNTDVKPLIDEFINLYYEDAAPFIQEYIALMAGTVREKAANLQCMGKGQWLDSNTVMAADDIFKRALAANVSDTVKQRLEDAYSSIRYAAIVCPPKITVGSDKIALDRPPCMTVDEYIAHVTARGAKSFDANRPLPDYIIERTGKAASPRHEESPIEKLENEQYVLWIAPALKGSVIRWTSKIHGAELLRGYETYGSAPGSLQEWSTTPLQEGPAADTYEVVERSAERLVLRAARTDGMQIERVMELKPGSDAFDVTLTLLNPTDKPLPADVKIHPEFRVQGVPEIWIFKTNAWEQQNKDWDGHTTAMGRPIPTGDVSRIRCWMPATKLSIDCSFDAGEVGGLFWYFNSAQEAQQCNLEVLSKSEPVAPKDKRVVHVGYSVSTKHPPAM